jgi:hypothetical protein
LGRIGSGRLIDADRLALAKAIEKVSFFDDEEEVELEEEEFIIDASLDPDDVAVCCCCVNDDDDDNEDKDVLPPPLVEEEVVDGVADVWIEDVDEIEPLLCAAPVVADELADADRERLTPVDDPPPTAPPLLAIREEEDVDVALFAETFTADTAPALAPCNPPPAGSVVPSFPFNSVAILVLLLSDEALGVVFAEELDVGVFDPTPPCALLLAVTLPLRCCC